ncbi:MAG: phosphatidylinositol-specific phospholipase C1-like protein [Gemmataceae bacterium]
MTCVRFSFLAILAALPITESSTPAHADDLRINQIQVIGTHNSYHVAPAPAIKSLLNSLRKGWVEQIDYTHRPLTEQLETLGIRQVELDVFADPKGGLFANPQGRKLAQGNGDAGPDPNADGILSKPGFKILHVQDVDYRSTVPTFAMALAEIRRWSVQHPQHVPILIHVELKDEAIPLLPTKPVPYDAKLLDGIDAEIRKAFPAEAIITPDLVRGSAETLKLAIQTHGWPTLESSRGKVLFLLDNEGTIGKLYRQDRPSLKGRAMFALCPESDAGAAMFKLNEPLREFDTIQRLVKSGFMVRTRSDADMVESRKNDTTRRDKALASGAQFVSTDFPEVRKEVSPFVVRLPGNAVARVNPISGPKGMTGDVEK